MHGRIPWGAFGYASAGCIAIIAAAVIPAPHPIQITALNLVSAVAFGGSALLLPLGLGFTKISVLPFGIVKSGIVLTAAAVGLQVPAIIGPPLRAALSDLHPFKRQMLDGVQRKATDIGRLGARQQLNSIWATDVTCCCTDPKLALLAGWCRRRILVLIREFRHAVQGQRRASSPHPQADAQGDQLGHLQCEPT